MEKITQKEADKMIEEGREEIRKILNDGGKITDIIVREKDKVTQTRKIEPVNGEATSFTIVQTKSEIYSFME